MQQTNQSNLSINKNRQNSNADKRQAYVESWRKSGLSMSAFCRQNNLAISSFSGWTKQSKDCEKIFKPLIGAASNITQDAEVGVIEISFQNSVKIRFLNSPNLSLVLRVVKELAGCS